MIDVQVRLSLIESLLRMKDDLCNFEQTSHGALRIGTIEHVAEYLVKTWNEPRPYNISNLIQAIGALNV